MCVLNVPRAEHFTHANTRHPSIAIWRFRLKIDKYKTRALQYYYYYIIYNTYTNLYSSAFGPVRCIKYIIYTNTTQNVCYISPWAKLFQGRTLHQLTCPFCVLKLIYFIMRNLKGKKITRKHCREIENAKRKRL